MSRKTQRFQGQHYVEEAIIPRIRSRYPKMTESASQTVKLRLFHPQKSQHFHYFDSTLSPKLTHRRPSVKKYGIHVEIFETFIFENLLDSDVKILIIAVYKKNGLGFPFSNPGDSLSISTVGLCSFRRVQKFSARWLRLAIGVPAGDRFLPQRSKIFRREKKVKICKFPTRLDLKNRSQGKYLLTLGWAYHNGTRARPRFAKFRPFQSVKNFWFRKEKKSQNRYPNTVDEF